MNEFAKLQNLREEVTEPTGEQLAPAFARLEHAMHRETELRRAAAGQVAGAEDRAPVPVPATSHVANRRRRTRRRVAWSTGALAGVVATMLVGGNVATAVESARTSALLREIAGTTVNFDDAELAPGQYLLSSTREDWTARTISDESSSQNVTQSDVYMPANAGDEWTLVRDWGTQEAATAESGSGVSVERLTAPYGAFYVGKDPKLVPEDAGPDFPTAASPQTGVLGVKLEDIPTGSAQETYDWIDSQYQGMNISRDDDNFSRIARLLGSGLMPAAQRAALLEALALVPGVTSTADVKNLDGVAGVAFGRSEPGANGSRSEIIVDPKTGFIIGERMVSGTTVLGFNTLDELTGVTAIKTTVVDSIPEGTTLAQ